MALAELDDLVDTSPMLGIWGRPILVAIGDSAHAGDLGAVAAAAARHAHGSVVIFTIDSATSDLGDPAIEPSLTPALRHAVDAVDQYGVPYRVDVGHQRLSADGSTRIRELAWTIWSRARHWDADSIVVGVPRDVPDELHVHRHLSVGGGIPVIPVPLDDDGAGRVRPSWRHRLDTLPSSRLRFRSEQRSTQRPRS